MRICSHSSFNSSSDTAGLLASTQLIYSFVSFFYVFIYFIVIANIIFFFQIDRSEPSFTDSVFRLRFRFRFRFHDSVSVSGFRVLVLPLVAYSITFNIAIHLHVTHNQVIGSILP